jgi:hypothetical protein
MAFHQPTRQAMQRVVRPATEDRQVPSLQSPAAQEQQPNESQTWVLFSPATDITTTSYLAETEDTPGRSLQSDIGSLHTLARSDRHVDPVQPYHSSAIDDYASVEEDGELDSLDSHLPEFRSLPGVPSQSHQTAEGAQAVFPSHDGLGSFRLDNPVIGAEAQDHLYQFEKFNPRRTRKRRESLDRLQPELGLEEAQEYEKRRRIEDWRLDHSRYMLEEIQRETRRRRRSQASTRRRTTVASAPTGEQAIRDDSDNMTWHDEEATTEDEPCGGFLSQITRTFIKDILGLDDRMLSILTGETTVDMEDDLSSTPKASQMAPAPQASDNEADSWQVQMLERVSHELGLLVNHFSHHPGAFSAYARMQHMPLPYGGLPVIPESSSLVGDVTSGSSGPSQPSFPEFLPTVPQASSRPIDIPSKTEPSVADDANRSNTFTKEEWEQDLDIKVVFRYLRSRFTSRGTGSGTGPSGSANYMASLSAQELAAKAARVRQHHPLISRGARTAERRSFMRPSSPIVLRHHHQSSCASQSTRRSARRSSVSSSRHYWDLGGSLGTGSMVASNGPMGSWGEV